MSAPYIVEDCERQSHARELCGMHYGNMLRNGSPTERMKMGPDREPIDVRFWRHVAVAGPDECWMWTGAKFTHGYGSLNKSGAGVGRITAHRYSAMLHFGMFDRRLQVNHHCDNRACVNPAHLYLGTHADNMRDMRERNRHAHHTQTHCKRGHEFTETNTRLYRGRRNCRTCQREVYDAARSQRKASA